MRLPFSRVYRAFPELDGFSNQECERYVRHVQRHSGWRISLTALSVTLGAMFFLPVMAVLTRGQLFRGLPSGIVGVFLVIGIVGLFTGPLWGYVARDVLLRRAILRRIRRASCSECGYSLIGLRAIGGRVVCPECGRTITLAQHDLSEGDLVADRAPTTPPPPTAAAHHRPGPGAGAR